MITYSRGNVGPTNQFKEMDRFYSFITMKVNVNNFKRKQLNNCQMSNWYSAESIKCYLKLSILLKINNKSLASEQFILVAIFPSIQSNDFPIEVHSCIPCVASYSHCNPQQPQLSPSFSQLHRKWSDNVCMMHILNTLAICSSASVQQKRTEKNLTEEKKLDGNHLTSNGVEHHKKKSTVSIKSNSLNTFV